MYILIYLGAFFPWMGSFTSEEDAQAYIEKFGNDPNNYDIVKIEVNHDIVVRIESDAPHSRYVGTGFTVK